MSVIDLSQPDATVASLVREACLSSGFFYGVYVCWAPLSLPRPSMHYIHAPDNTDLWSLAVINHGVDEALVAAVFEENRKFFALPTAQKELIIADCNNRRGRFLAYRRTTRDVLC